MHIAVFVPTGVFDSGLTIFLDAFCLAASLGPKGQAGASRWRVTLTGEQQQTRTHLGLELETPPLAASDCPSVWVVPALFVPSAPSLYSLRSKRPFAVAAQTLQQAAASGAVVATACSGAFFAGQAGILDGRHATCAWWLAPTFRSWFPQVKLDERRMLVRDGQVITAGGGLGHLNLALYLIRQQSPQLAQVVSQYLAVDSSPSQTPFFLHERMHHADPLILPLEAYLREHMSQPFDLLKVAAHLGVSPRSLQRRVRQVLGRSVMQLVHDLRLEQAVYRVRNGHESIDQIAQAVGYQNGETLRNLLRRRLGRGVRELRMLAKENQSQ